MRNDFIEWMEANSGAMPTAYHPSGDTALLQRQMSRRNAITKKGRDDYSYDYNHDPEHVLSEPPAFNPNSGSNRSTKKLDPEKTVITNPEIQGARNKTASKFVMSMGAFAKKE